MITLKEGQRLRDVLNEIPTNCILSKRIPGCGATTLELKTDRNSIIIVPNVPVIQLLKVLVRLRLPARNAESTFIPSFSC